jgi:hypothetical protein
MRYSEVSNLPKVTQLADDTQMELDLTPRAMFSLLYLGRREESSVLNCTCAHPFEERSTCKLEPCHPMFSSRLKAPFPFLFFCDCHNF